MFHEIAASIPDVTESKMFGALCIKAANGKAGVMFHKGNMIFKLRGTAEKEAMQLKDAKIFDPMGGRPMTGWVQLSPEHADNWKHYATIAMDEVKKIEVVKKKSVTKKMQ